jgi:hypothetical protein
MNGFFSWVDDRAPADPGDASRTNNDGTTQIENEAIGELNGTAPGSDRRATDPHFAIPSRVSRRCHTTVAPPPARRGDTTSQGCVRNPDLLRLRWRTPPLQEASFDTDATTTAIRDQHFLNGAFTCRARSRRDARRKRHQSAAEVATLSLPHRAPGGGFRDLREACTRSVCSTASVPNTVIRANRTDPSTAFCASGTSYVLRNYVLRSIVPKWDEKRRSKGCIGRTILRC